MWKGPEYEVRAVYKASAAPAHVLAVSSSVRSSTSVWGVLFFYKCTCDYVPFNVIGYGSSIAANRDAV